MDLQQLSDEFHQLRVETEQKAEEARQLLKQLQQTSDVICQMEEGLERIIQSSGCKNAPSVY